MDENSTVEDKTKLYAELSQWRARISALNDLGHDLMGECDIATASALDQELSDVNKVWTLVSGEVSWDTQIRFIAMTALGSPLGNALCLWCLVLSLRVSTLINVWGITVSYPCHRCSNPVYINLRPNIQDATCIYSMRWDCDLQSVA